VTEYLRDSFREAEAD